jgi:hypothetical protein
MFAKHQPVELVPSTPISFYVGATGAADNGHLGDQRVNSPRNDTVDPIRGLQHLLSNLIGAHRCSHDGMPPSCRLVTLLTAHSGISNPTAHHLSVASRFLNHFGCP